MTRASGTILYSLIYFDSRRGYIRLKYLYPVIFVKIDSLPANTGAQQAGVDPVGVCRVGVWKGSLGLVRS